MKTAKTLWMLDVPYEEIRGSVLVPLYAEDEQEAWIEAQRWALRSDRTLPTNAKLVHFSQGFTMYRRVLPGSIEESASERNDE
jgi:hypothetical protein